MNNKRVWASDTFVLSAGSVLFRRQPETHELEICILHNLKNDIWCLPKGRKDRGEPIEVAAVRETFEETGYPCELLPCRMPTRAPPPNSPQKGSVIVDNAVEAFAMTMRPIAKDVVKFISWYLTKLKDGTTDKIDGTQTESENYESVFIQADAAVKRLDLPDDAEVARKAIQLVREALEAQIIVL